VAHIYNPNYSGDRDQEDRGSKPAQQIVHETLSQKKTIIKKGGWWSSSRCRPSSSPSTAKKKKKGLSGYIAIVITSIQ
jgi:hypothetical protein